MSHNPNRPVTATQEEVVNLTSSSDEGEDKEKSTNKDDSDVELLPLEEGIKGITIPQAPKITIQAVAVEIEKFSGTKNDGKDDFNSILPIPSVIPRKTPEAGYTVYGQVKSALCKWNLGIVVTLHEDDVFNMIEYDVKFDIPKIKSVNGEQRKGIRTIYRMLPANLLAYHIASPFKLPVGSRIIAILYNRLESAEANADNFFVGTIAEPLKPTNNRYLIFFDNGSAQYTRHCDVRLVYASSVKVWEDVYPETQKFIKEYLSKYPEVPLLSLTKDTRITVEWNGKPWISTVLEVDHSLVKLRFHFSGHSEWIYRGSERLLKFQPQRVYQTGEVGEGTSGTHPFSIVEHPVFGDIENYNYPLFTTFDSCLEYEGKLEGLEISSLQLPRNPNEDLCTSGHLCTSKCLGRYVPKDYEQVPPLAVPFHLGFLRIIGDRYVYYKGPCGKVLKNDQELHRYLMETKSELGIHQFTFSRSVRCASIFVPRTMCFKIKDISYGKNVMPVTCVNSLSMDMPVYFDYTNDRLPAEGVNINEDIGFLTCCDCVDDCQDQENCACWQLTLSGVAFRTPTIYNPRFPSPKGYEYRRLYDFVVSGIYECNKGCKCRKTCLNRVIQNSDARLPLQVFKTSKKGWAIRPLSDIPVGSFICTYGGQVLTEAKANEDGKKYGDEYLAEMDYIEVLENHKFGYESNPDISDNDADLNISQNSSVAVILSPVSHKSSIQPSAMESPIATPVVKSSRASNRKTMRQLFGKDEKSYIMDAKSIGNIGRYLNHSCDPNVFVQNVFVNSHDIRFPWVSFFASQTIKAGTELTWNYNYEVGGISGKVLYCYCGAPKCKGRLL